MTEVAAGSGVPVETLRKIESGRVPTPAFFTVAALATALNLSLDVIAGICEYADEAGDGALLPSAQPSLL
jgi:transcriptional regulator with XRE-family HTH domain